MKFSAQEFSKLKNKRLTLLGMSGVGKSHLAKLFALDDNWYHYSGDYRIGTKYLSDDIIENIKQKISRDASLAKLLDSIYIGISNSVNFDNMSLISDFLGKVGNPEQGGLPIDEFCRRQVLHREAEIKAMLDVPRFIEKSQQQGYNHFINDAGGSLGELDDDRVYETLAKHTLILYMKANKSSESALIERAQTHPKPLYYQPEFLKRQLGIYLQENHFDYVAQINPNAFMHWIFPRLLEYRKPKYEKIAKQYGYIIDSEQLYQCRSIDEALELIQEE